ncbi:MAG: cation transporter, partial [Bacteroidetes bacterium]|nr:cation transporter [Bacteroidota bacterium]
YYSKAIFPTTNGNVVMVHSDNIVKAEIQIEGMTCASCENSVDYALKSEAGVIKASSSYKTGIAKVEFDKSKVTEDRLKKTIEEKVGYNVKDIESIKN